MLILPIKKKWFDMILSGKKKEEYREIKPYYKSRFAKIFEMHPYSYIPTGLDTHKIIFRNGYRSDSPSFIATVTLDIGTGKTEWGAEEEKDYYILKICDIEPKEESEE
jgi:hypothetical protein